MDADVVVVGAGTAGAAAAALCAGRGLRTVLLDRRPLGEAGARWVNALPRWMFEAAGIDAPSGDELLSEGHRFFLVAGRGPERTEVRDHRLLEVDMRLLVARLQRMARDAGATLLGEARATGWDGTTLTTSARGEGSRIRAKHVVDASGVGGAGLVPVPKVAPSDLCAAAQEIRRVKDRGAARAFYESHGAREGDIVAFTSFAGGYSLLGSRLDGDHVSILTGSIPADGHPSGARLLSGFVEEQGWIGDTIFGGSRAIPLRRPLDRLAYGKVALLGDAACQVLAAHGSGIGPGLVAARVLADTLADGGDANVYAVRWMRAHGGLYAGYDVFRRFSQRLSLGDVRRLVATGLLSSESAALGLRQEMPKATPSLALSMLRGAARAPALAARMGVAVSRMQRAAALYAQYPYDHDARAAWASRVAKVLRDAPDHLTAT